MKTLSSFIIHTYHFFKEIPKSYKIGLGILLFINIIIKLFLVNYAPIFVDEAWTFFHFTSQGIGTSITEYPAPNNHILHSVLTNLSYYLPFNDTVNLRLPNFVVNIISILAFFIVFAKLFGYKTGFASVIIFSFSFPMMYYGYVARGYTLLLLFYIIVFYTSIQILTKYKHESIKRYLILLSIASILGFYTMPSFLYPYATTLVFLLYIFIKNKEQKLVKQLILSGFATSIVVILLYLPIFYYSGIDSVINNRYVHSTKLLNVIKNMPHHFNESSIFLIYLPLFVALPLFGILIWQLKKTNWNNVVLFAVFSIIITPLILIIHRVTPFPRTWIYLLIPIIYLLATYINQKLKNFTYTSKVFMLISVFAVIQITYDVYMMRQFDHMSYEIKNVSKYIRSKNVQQIYIGKNAYLGTNLKYIFRKNKNIHLTENEHNIDINNIDNFDFLILRKEDAKNIGHLKEFKRRYIINETGWIHEIFERIK